MLIDLEKKAKTDVERAKVLELRNKLQINSKEILTDIVPQNKLAGALRINENYEFFDEAFPLTNDSRFLLLLMESDSNGESRDVAISELQQKMNDTKDKALSQKFVTYDSIKLINKQFLYPLVILSVQQLSLFEKNIMLAVSYLDNLKELTIKLPTPPSIDSRIIDDCFSQAYTGLKEILGEFISKNNLTDSQSLNRMDQLSKLIDDRSSGNSATVTYN